MKNYLLNTLPFVFAFIVVTGVLIYLNGQFNNIFQFDFTPKNQISQRLNDSLNVKKTTEQNSTSNDLKKFTDTLTVSDLNADTVVNTGFPVGIREEENHIKPDLKELSKKELENQLNKKPEPESDKIEPKFASDNLIQSSTSKQQKQDSTYTNWLKKVSKLLEQMEPSKASKIIQNYSDNVARDIIYTMNKKSAAKIVSELSPEIAQRIIRYD